MITFFEILWWIVLFPVLCTFVVNLYWCRKLQITKGAPPYASIIIFIFGGWYGFVVAFCVLMGGGLMRLFHLPATPQEIQGQVGVEFICTLVGLATAFGGKFLANKLTRSRTTDDSEQKPDAHGKLNSI